MQLKHFKKRLIMTQGINKWTKTCKALKGLLDILYCAKCKNSLHDPQQFLKCGHFSCISCINNDNTSCIQCKLPCEGDDVIKDDTIESIIKACCVIAEEVGYSSNIENIELKPEKTENDSSIPVNNLNLHSNNSNESFNHTQKKPVKNLKKRKRNFKFHNEDSKKPKCTTPVLLNIPKNINKRNPVGETKLQEECRKNHEENARILLEANADPNIGCYADWTPLQESADYGFLRIAELLLKHGAAVNKAGHEGRTALHEAVEKNNFPMVELLLKHGAESNVADKRGVEPIHLCRSEEMRAILGYHKTENNVRVKEPKTEKRNKRISSAINGDSSSSSGTSKFNESSPRKREKKICSFKLGLKRILTTAINGDSSSSPGTSGINESSSRKREKKICDLKTESDAENSDAEDEIKVVYTNIPISDCNNDVTSQMKTSTNTSPKVDAKNISCEAPQESIETANNKDNLDKPKNGMSYSQESIDVITINSSQTSAINGSCSQDAIQNDLVSSQKASIEENIDSEDFIDVCN